MSFILDALKKSETERARQSGPALLEMRIVRPSRLLPAWAVIVGMLLIACVGVLGWLAWRPAPTAVTIGLPTTIPATTIEYAQATAANAPPDAAIQTAPAPASATKPRSAAIGLANNQTGINPADAEPAVAPDPGAARGENSASDLRNYSELNGSLPELRLDLHVYAVNPAERYAFINMHKVREGDLTPEGAQVRQITRDGVVLDFHGTEFLLGR